MMRSGTHHLHDLLSAHSRIAPVAIREDYLFHGADALERYAGHLEDSWHRFWAAKAAPAHYAADTVLAALGERLLAHLAADPSQPIPDGARPLLKAPTLGHAEATFRLFPDAQVLVLLRDPRSAVASYRRSRWWQGESLEHSAVRWADAARALEAWLLAEQDRVRAGQIRLVRYERLVEDPRHTLASVLETLDLAAEAACLAHADTAPVIGSSYLTPDAAQAFAARERPAGFDPRRRWATWTDDDHRRFVRVCGAQMERWGYAVPLP
jgi:hypothetical protein